MTVWIEFFDDSGARVLGMQGRWTNTTQRAERKHLHVTSETVEVSIPANGRAEPLDIAMKRPGDADAFAFNDDNGSVLDLMPETHRLRGERFRVVVTLRGENADPVEGTFVHTNEGKGGSITLALEETPPI